MSPLMQIYIDLLMYFVDREKMSACRIQHYSTGVAEFRPEAVRGPTEPHATRRESQRGGARACSRWRHVATDRFAATGGELRANVRGLPCV